MRAWNLLQLPGMNVVMVADLLGIEDIDMLVTQLLVIQSDKGARHG